MKTAEQIRSEYLAFFKERGHAVVPSAPLVPDDPTLLFTNAGMVQFKDVFLGAGARPYMRAADTQKCLRVSGKHNDLGEVGFDTTHHTFFEMLGNWSFGDYFKREAIGWAWELLVDGWGLDPSRLYATVHEGDKTLDLDADEEAASLWRSETDIDPDHILRFGSKDNFWMMGDTGPCGPCSEITVDLRPDDQRAKLPGRELVNGDHPQVVEVWNLVFIQYNAMEDGTLEPLKAKHVDTGMGLERIVSVLQGKANNYETDLFTPILERVRQLRGHTVEQMKADIVPYRVLADHGRAMAFLLADGVVPGNEKQKYVLRMVMRRALRFGRKLGIDKPFLAEVGQAVIENMGKAFPELVQDRATILRWAEQEEKLFGKTLDRGLTYFEEHVARLKKINQKTMPGEDAFYLHDTLGFPIEVTEDLAKEIGFALDRKGFDAAMAQQKERSRGADGAKPKAAKGAIKVSAPATRFLGYETLACEAKLISAHTTERGAVFVFDQTPFYAEGGGQRADTGTIENVSGSGKANVTRIRRNEGGAFLHDIKIVSGVFQAGDRCRLCVTTEPRKATERNHTATHLLHAALHRVLGEHAKQAGSLVAPDELRFDFSHFEAVTPEQIAQIEDFANRAILDDLEVVTTEETLEEAKAKGAMALFAEDYQGKETVRLVSILTSDGGAISRELCGGTHVCRTGEIGGFKIVSEESVSAGVRRVKVATGVNLIGHVRELDERLTRAAAVVDANPTDLVTRLEALVHSHATLQRELALLRGQQVESQVDGLLQQCTAVGGAKVLVAQSELAGDELKQLVDLIEGRLDGGIVLLGGAGNGRPQLVCKVAKSLTNRIKAGELIKALTPIIGGGGGGAPHFAQGGGTQPDKLGEALKRGTILIQDALG